MWLVSTFEKIYLKKIFFVSTFLDWYNLRNLLLIITPANKVVKKKLAFFKYHTAFYHVFPCPLVSFLIKIPFLEYRTYSVLPF